MYCTEIDINVDYKKIGIDNNGYQPKLYTYVMKNIEEIDIKRKRPAVIICPGGGYEFISDREAEPIAIRLNSLGFQAFVLKYSVKTEFPGALVELSKAVAIIRENAEEWCLDTNKIIVAGFSAGGHLVASLGAFWDRDFLEEYTKLDKELIKPNGLLLSYPVITSTEFAHRDSFINLLGRKYNELLEFVSIETQITDSFPPVFLWHTYTDNLVPVENSLKLAIELKKHNIPLEMHIYAKGNHGLALATEETMSSDNDTVQLECSNWIDLFAVWFKNNF